MEAAKPFYKRTGSNREILSTLIIFLAWLGIRIYVHEHNWINTDFSTSFLEDDGQQWYYPMSYAKDNFLKSILYQRGEGPLPQFLMTLLVKAFGWPFNAPIDSFLLAIFTLFQALMMRSLIRFSGFGLYIASAAAVLWVLSTDCLSFEMEAWTRAFYDAVTGFLFMLSVWVYYKAINTGKPSFSWLFGFICAILILSRSTLSLFFIIPFFASLFLKHEKKILIGLIPLLFQTGWGIKNYYAFGQFQFQLSSIAGSMIQTPLLHAGLRGDFIGYAFRNFENSDVCALHFIENPSKIDPTCREILEKVLATDKKLQEKIDSTGKFVAGRNSYADYLITQEVKPVYVRYMLSHPEVVVVLFKRTFPIFWQISELGISAWYGNSPTSPRIFSTMRQVFFGITSINKVILNSASLIAFIFLSLSFFYRGKEKKYMKLSCEQIVFLYAFISFSYIQFFACVVGGIESNRYRFAIEPVIWVLPFLTWRCIEEIRRQKRKTS